MLKHLPAVLFSLSCAMVVFAFGLLVGDYKFPPYGTIANGIKTIKATYRDLTWTTYLGQFKEPTGVALEDVASARLIVAEAGRDHPERYLVNGGLNEFLEHCPEYGCVAVDVDRDGEVHHAYPYRPYAIFAADITEGSFYREGVPADPLKKMRPMGVQLYENGDLLIVFQSVRNMFPFAAGVARVDRDGQPRWFRFDYSHHWSTVLPDGTALVPSLRVGDGDWTVPIGPGFGSKTVACETKRPQIDEVQLLDAEGDVIRTLDISTTLKASNWNAMLIETTNGCDPLHLNHVDVIGDDAGPGLVPGDLVLSLRNLSAFAIADPVSGEIKDVIRGTFIQQHSVHHLGGSRFPSLRQLGRGRVRSGVPYRRGRHLHRSGASCLSHDRGPVQGGSSVLEPSQPHRPVSRSDPGSRCVFGYREGGRGRHLHRGSAGLVRGDPRSQQRRRCP